MHLSPEERLRLRADVLRQIGRRRTKKQLLDRLCRYGEDLVSGARFMITRRGDARERSAFAEGPPATFDAGDGSHQAGALHVASAPTLPLSVERWRIPIGANTTPWGVAVERDAPVYVPDTREAPWRRSAGIFDHLRAGAIFVTPYASFGGACKGTISMHFAEPRRPCEQAGPFLLTCANLVEIIYSLADLDAGEFARGDHGARDLAFVKDRTLRYRCANRAAAFSCGRQPHEIEGLTDRDLFPPDVANTTQQADERVLATGKPYSYEINYSNRQGSNRSYVVEKFPLSAGDGSIDGLFCVAHDVTELRAAKRAMHTARRLRYLGLVAGSITHDFNNALAAIIARADEALRHLDADAPVRAALVDVRSAASRAADFSARLLLHTREERARQERVDVRDVARDARDLLRPTVDERKALTLDVADSLTAVRGDPSQVRQIVMNLVTNASDAIGEQGGTIRLEVAASDGVETHEADVVLGNGPRAGRFVRLSCEDDGCGIPDSAVERIFDPFFTTKPDGHGLGLAGVLDIVLEHRGHVAVRTTAGGGTRFDVYLPAERETG